MKTTGLVFAQPAAEQTSENEGLRAWLETYAQLVLREEPGCVSVTHEGAGVFRLSVSPSTSCADKAGMLSMSMMTLLDVASEDLGQRFVLGC